MLTIYCDTCIYRDYYEWRPGKYWLHFGEEAKKLLERIKYKEFKLVVSDHLGYQLEEFPQYQHYITELRKEDNLIEVKASEEDKQRAREESEKRPKTGFEDALHAELAIKGGASVFVTRNIEHFASYSTRIKISTPEHVGIF